MFRFRAAPLLALRQHELEAAQERLALATRAVEASERRLTEVEAAGHAAVADYRAVLGAGTDQATLERHRYWIGQQHGLVERHERERAACREAVAIASGAVVAVHRQVRVLERLRDRSLRRHEAEVRRREDRDIDRLATLQYARRLAEGGTV